MRSNDETGIVTRVPVVLRVIAKAARIFAIIREVGHATFKEWAVYRSHMFLSLIIGPITFFIQMSIWQAVFTGRTTVNGLTMHDMIVYYGLVTLMNYLIMDFADWNLQMLVHTGRFLTFALRPLSHLLFAFSQKVGHRVLGFFLEFLPVYICFVIIFKITFIPKEPGWFFVSLALSFCMNFFINYSVGILGFWFVRTDGVRFVFQFARALCAGEVVPLSFFPGVLQGVLFFLPFQYITYVPIRIFFGDYALAGIRVSVPAIVALQALAVCIMWFVTHVLFRLGIRKFTGSGA